MIIPFHKVSIESLEFKMNFMEENGKRVVLKFLKIKMNFAGRIGMAGLKFIE